MQADQGKTEFDLISREKMRQHDSQKSTEAEAQPIACQETPFDRPPFALWVVCRPVRGGAINDCIGEFGHPIFAGWRTADAA